MRIPLSLVVLTLGTASLAAQPGVPREVVDGWKAYEGRFVHASGGYRSTASIREGKRLSAQTGGVTFAFAPAGRRAELKVSEGPKQLVWRVTCSSSKYVFRLERGGAGWVLREVYNQGDPAGKPLQDELDVLLAPVRSLGVVEGVRLTELASDLGPDPANPSTGLTLAKERQFTTGKNKLTFRKLSVRLDGPPFHTLTSAAADVVMNKSAGRIEVSVDRQEVGGLPVPVHLNRREHYPPGAAGTGMEMEDDVTFAIDPAADPPEQEFTLSAYNLPEPVGVEWAKPTPRYVWFLLAAAVFAVLAIGFRYLARRRAAKASAPVPT